MSSTVDSSESVPRVALVSTRVTEEESYVEARSALAYDYVTWLERDGWLVVPVPTATTRPDAYLDLPGVALVVLTGGNNVDPALYGGRGGVSQVYPERDRVEFGLLDGARERTIPVWGVCRGLHTINVYFGGRLTQTVSGHVARDHALVSGHVELSGALCNSYHNQAVRGDDLSRELRVFAYSDDDVVEALYHPTEQIAAVQWHPERQERAYDYTLFHQFLAGSISAESVTDS
jgi:gamma-glutamyl-gamma-aminobutyrate hydrolase PuuD